MSPTSWFVKVVRSGARYEDGTLPAEVWRENEVCPTLNAFDNNGESRAVVTIIHPIQNTVIGRDRKSTRLNSSHSQQSRMPSSA